MHSCVAPEEKEEPKNDLLSYLRALKTSEAPEMEAKHDALLRELWGADKEESSRKDLGYRTSSDSERGRLTNARGVTGPSKRYQVEKEAY